MTFVASVWHALTGHGEVHFDSVTMFVFFLSLGLLIVSASQLPIA